MERFNFPYHVAEIETAENSSVLELKGGFTFASKPAGPFIKTFTLSFSTLKFFEAPDGTPSVTEDPKVNMMTLYQFYLTHGLWKTFIYPSPIFGDTEVKFLKPVKIPRVTGNQGATLNVEVVLKEQPNVNSSTT